MAAISMREIEKNKKQTSIKSMYFNRYLGVRYALAIFFFCNIYWLLSLILSHSSTAVLPAINIMVSIMAMYEQIKIFSSHTSDAKSAKLTFLTLTIINILTLIMIWIPSMFERFYPFINKTETNQLIMSLILLLGLILSITILNKLKRIHSNQDKQFNRVKRYEKII